MAKFAEKTTTQVSTSQDEVRRIIRRYGGSRMLLYTDEENGTGIIQFEMRDRLLRFSVEMPPLSAFERDRQGYLRRPAQAEAAWEQEERRRWRVLVILLKGKLESVSDEAVPFDQEFLANIVLPDRSTVGEHLVPRVAEAYEEGHMPDMLEVLLPRRLKALPPPKDRAL